MERWRFVVGMVGAALIVASGCAHTLVGWKVMRAGLVAAGAPLELVTGLGIGWIFGGVSMFGFGSIAIATILARRRGVASTRGPIVIIAIVYIVFGLGALVASRFDPFFLIFILPGLLLAMSVWPSRASGRS